MRGLLYIVLLCLLTLMGGVSGCSNADCSDYRSTLPQAGFYADIDGEVSAITFDSLTVKGIGAPGDSLLLDAARSAAGTWLPLPPERREASFAFIYATSPRLVADTITIEYTPSPHFASAECGVVYYYAVKTISSTHTLLDSVQLLSNPITNVPLENMRLFFHYTPAPTPL